MILNLNIMATNRVNEKHHSYNRGIFGLAFNYCEYPAYSGLLTQGEDLFISARSCSNTIGSEFGDPSFDPPGLAIWLDSSVLPWSYARNIYVSASGAHPSFINGGLLELEEGFVNRVFGILCIEEDHIEPPSHRGWITTTD